MESQRSVYASNHFFQTYSCSYLHYALFKNNDVKKSTVFPGNKKVKVTFLEKKMLQCIHLVLGEATIYM